MYICGHRPPYPWYPPVSGLQLVFFRGFSNKQQFGLLITHFSDRLSHFTSGTVSRGEVCNKGST